MTRPLAGPDKAILDLLAAERSFDEVCDIGHHRQAWKPSDVHAVVCRWLSARVPARLRDAPRPPRKPRLLPTSSWSPPLADEPERTATTTPACAALLEQLCRGADMPEAAEALHIAQGTARNQARRLLVDVGAYDRAQAVALVLSGRVAVQVAAHRPAAPGQTGLNGDDRTGSGDGRST